MTRNLRIVSDFDGVWTDPREEAARILGVIVTWVSEHADLPREDVRAHVEALVTEISREPHRYGWVVDGRISAYADEDPFILNNAVCMALATAEPAVGGVVRRAAIRAAICGQIGDGIELARASYHEGSAAAIAAGEVALLPGARDVLDRVLATGAELVIVSNSSPEKVCTLFGGAGIDLAVAAGSNPRARGNACKFLFSSEPPPPAGMNDRVLGGRRVSVDRGHYQSILVEERPDLVVGDVLSLDLALPACLARDGAELERLEVALRRRAGTPSWSVEALSDLGGGHVWDSLEDLASWAEGRAS